jgi:hypothetical protein
MKDQSMSKTLKCRKGTIVSLENPKGKTPEIPSTIHHSGLCEPSDHFRDFMIMNFIMLES